MFKVILKNSLKIIIVWFLLVTFLQGCHVPLLYLYHAGQSEKDVSADFKRGHVVGKEYVLLQDAYLTQFRDSQKLTIRKDLPKMYVFENGKRVEFNLFLIIKTIPKNSRFRVCSVFVETNYGREGHCQNILAKFIDEKGNILDETNACGEIVPVEIGSLFQNTSQMPGENWIFIPSLEWIKEISRH